MKVYLVSQRWLGRSPQLRSYLRTVPERGVDRARPRHLRPPLRLLQPGVQPQPAERPCLSVVYAFGIIL